MLKSDIKILIVEDDHSMASAIDEATKRAGYSPKVYNDVEKARVAFEREKFHCAIIDCMLPGLNGVDLAKEFHQKASDSFNSILISGIYKDRQFKKEALRKTNAVGFLVKPFDIQDLISLIDDTFVDKIDQERTPLHDLLSIEDLTNSHRLRAIENTDSFNGLELPLIYSTLIQSSLSGELTLQMAEPDIQATIKFAKGRIHNVHSNDKESFFGVLLIEKGLTFSEDVEKGLSLESDKPIGERLVDINSLSPHAIEIVQREQSLIRLSKTVREGSVQCQFTECAVEESRYSIGQSEFLQILHEWALSKFSNEWLKTYYTTWLGHTVAPGPLYNEALKAVDHFALLENSTKMLKMINTVPTLDDLIEVCDLEEEFALRVLHFLLVNRNIILGSIEENAIDQGTRVMRLESILKKMSGQNHFEVLGVSQDAQKSEIQAAYHEYAKVFHPDKVAQNSNTDIRNLSKQIFDRINESHQILADQDKRDKYKKSLDMGMAEEVLENEHIFDQAQDHLMSGKYNEALKILQNLKERRGHPHHTLIHYLWARIKVGWPMKQTETIAKELEGLFRTIPPEDRHNTTYFFVRGLFKVALGDYEKGKTYLKHTIQINPNFLPAKRELIAVRQLLRGGRKAKVNEQTVFSDLSSAFTGIFKKKSS